VRAKLERLYIHTSLRGAYADDLGCFQRWERSRCFWVQKANAYSIWSQLSKSQNGSFKACLKTCSPKSLVLYRPKMGHVCSWRVKDCIQKLLTVPDLPFCPGERIPQRLGVSAGAVAGDSLKTDQETLQSNQQSGRRLWFGLLECLDGLHNVPGDLVENLVQLIPR
jgi:hypothetical protein